MKLTLVTATGDRPEAFALCEKYMDRQTRKDAICQWIVLDDGEMPTVCTKGQDLARNVGWRGPGSLVNKIKYVLEGNLVIGDYLVFIEDDDWYHPKYLEILLERIAESGADLVGEGDALYYNVESRWWCTHANMGHASLCQTAISKTLLPHLLKHCQQNINPFIDSLVWTGWNMVKKKVYPVHPFAGHTCIGIKSMPGRAGYGVGHNVNRVGRHAARPVKEDPTLTQLHILIGSDADEYERFYFKNKQPTKPDMTNIYTTHTGEVRGPRWLYWLGHLKDTPNIIGMELGTFQGESAEWFLDNICTNASARFMCIDTFEGSIEHKVGNIDCTKNEALAIERLKRFGDRVAIHKGMSHDLMRDLNIFELDFIYVDADHSTRGVLRDAVYAFDLLKVGGIMVFDDYEWNVMPNPLDCPKTGIDAFLKCYAKEIEHLEPKVGWQVAIRKAAK